MKAKFTLQSDSYVVKVDAGASSFCSSNMLPNVQQNTIKPFIEQTVSKFIPTNMRVMKIEHIGIADLEILSDIYEQMLSVLLVKR